MFINRFSTTTSFLVIAAITLITLLTMNAFLEPQREGIANVNGPQDSLNQGQDAPLNSDTYYPLPPGKQTALDNPMAGITDPQVRRDLARLRRATVKYHHVDAALADGFIQTPACVQDPELGGMGIHFIHPDRLMDPAINLLEPEILLYVETKHGMKLLGVEYFQGIGAPDTPIPDPAPPAAVIFGRPLDGPMEAHEPGQPPHYDLHVWLWQANPSGIFAPFNPNVSCQ
jgi:hypothetical protein